MHANLLTGIDHSTSPLNLVDQSQSLSDQPAPPSRFTLQAFSKSTPGRILGSYTTKAIGGFLIGLGLAFSWTGLGIGLVAAGAVIWIASTAVSTAGLEQHNLIQVASHLCISVFFGITGMYGGVLNFGIGAASLASLPPQLISVGGGLPYFSLLAPLLDFLLSTKAKSNPVSQLNIPNIGASLRQNGIVESDKDSFNSEQSSNRFATLVPGSIRPRLESQPDKNPPQFAVKPEQTNPLVNEQIEYHLAEIYKNNKFNSTVRYTTLSDEKVILHMDKWVAYQASQARGRLSCEWVAVPHRYPPIEYRLMEKSAYDILMTSKKTGSRLAGVGFPEHGVFVSDQSTFQGTELLRRLYTVLWQISVPKQVYILVGGSNAIVLRSGMDPHLPIGFDRSGRRASPHPGRTSRPQNQE